MIRALVLLVLLSAPASAQHHVWCFWCPPDDDPSTGCEECYVPTHTLEPTAGCLMQHNQWISWGTRDDLCPPPLVGDPQVGQRTNACWYGLSNTRTGHDVAVYRPSCVVEGEDVRTSVRRMKQ